MKNNEIKHSEPLFHISKRSDIVWWKAWLVRLGAIVLALFVSAVLTVVLTGENPLDVFSSLIKGAIGTNRRIWVLFQNTAIIMPKIIAMIGPPIMGNMFPAISAGIAMIMHTIIP